MPNSLSAVHRLFSLLRHVDVESKSLADMWVYCLVRLSLLVIGGASSL